MEDDKAEVVAEVMRTLRVDKLTVDLFCAILCLYKWKVEEAAEYFNVCRGKPQIREQSLKQKFVLQCKFFYYFIVFHFCIANMAILCLQLTL